jgi:hypothetical protein
MAGQFVRSTATTKVPPGFHPFRPGTKPLCNKKAAWPFSIDIIELQNIAIV